MSYTVGDTIYTTWRVLDSNGAFVTGLSASDFDVRLMRDDAVATEAVNIRERSGGVYVFSFQVTSTGVYSLLVQEKDTYAGSLQSGFAGREFLVQSAGASFSAAWSNAFCAETDVERVLGRSLSATSQPSSTEAAAFAEEVASELTAICEAAGSRITPSGGDSPLSATGSGVQLEDMLRQANALGVAWRVETASYKGVPPNDSGRAAVFYLDYIRLAGGIIPGTKEIVPGRIPAYIKQTAGASSWSGTHISTGQATAYAPTTAIVEDLKFTEDTNW